MRVRALLVIVSLLSLAGGAAADDLAAFLAAATAAARPQTTVRGDGELVTTSPEGTVQDRVAVIRFPDGAVYIELKQSGARALLSADGSSASLVAGAGTAPAPFALDAAFAGSEFTREDLQPFSAERYRSPTIVDRSASEVTVSLTPQASQYALQVVSFDQSRKVPVKVMLYKETASNLVKMRRDRGFASVGGTALPTEVTIENFPLRTSSAMKLAWKPADDLAGLADPAALQKPSPLLWPQSQD